MIGNFQYGINLFDKARFERIDINFERISTVGQCYQTALHTTEKWLMKGSQLIQQTSLLSYFKKLSQSPQPSATTTLISQQQSTLRQDFLTAKNYDSLKSQMWLAFYNNEVFLKFKYIHFLDISLLLTQQTALQYKNNFYVHWERSFIANFALLQCSEIETAIRMRYACVFITQSCLTLCTP